MGGTGNDWEPWGLYAMNHRITLGTNPVRFGQKNSFQPIAWTPGQGLKVPDQVIIPSVAGDGIGPEIMPEAQRVVNAAVKKAYGMARSIQWLPLTIGEKALAAGKKLIPDEVLDQIKQHHVFVKGPVGTPIGKGFRSVNVELRKQLDLYACIRPVKALAGVMTPMKVDQTDIVLFRENTEDVYQGVEFKAGSRPARILAWTLNTVFPWVNRLFGNRDGSDGPSTIAIHPDSAIGIKPASEEASKRLVRRAIQYAIDHKRPSVTLVGKGNIMKFTEGEFLEWGKQVAREEFPGQTISDEDFRKTYGGDYKKAMADGKVVIQERLTDAMCQDIVLNPQWHSVIATTNLNGDLMSDILAATVGGLGIAPGANIGEKYAMFESTHGTAPTIAGKNIANPTALMLTMGMMLDHLGWKEAAQKLRHGIEKTLAQGKMTGDLAVKAGKPALSTTDYTQAVIEAIESDDSKTAKVA